MVRHCWGLTVVTEKPWQFPAPAPTSPHRAEESRFGDLPTRVKRGSRAARYFELTNETEMTMRSLLLPAFLFCAIVTSVGCGPNKPLRRDPSLADLAIGPHHDYTSTWVYAVGEVESPSDADCKKALVFVEAEQGCASAGCKYGSNLVKDFEFACKKIATPAQRSRMVELRSLLAPRTAQAPGDCVQEVDEWLERGCGKDGACEAKVQQWATHCAEELKSPLALHLMERLVENSLTEPRRVKFDVRSCGEYKQKLAEAAKCSKPFECEDALPHIDEYLERCAEGQRKAVPLAQAAQIVHIRLGADKPIEPIALVGSMSRLTSVEGTIALADGSGAVLKVCGESVAELGAYLEQRAKCQNGELTLLQAVATEGGSNLELQKLRHESDTTFGLAHPKLVVVGEVAARDKKTIDAFAAALGSLPQQAAQDLAVAFEQANQTYAAVSPQLRQSDELYKALAPHDEALVTMFGLIGEQKAHLVDKRLNDGELLGLMRRAEKLVFADMSKKGVVGLSKTNELSELLLDQALPRAFAAYKQKLGKLRSTFDKRRISTNDDPAVARQTLMTYTQVCSAARTQVAAAQQELTRCLDAADACGAEERSKWASSLEMARSEWRSARVQEILAKVGMSLRETPSAVCNSW